MKFIEPSAELITESNALRKIEKIGRMCYKSEDKITDNSAERFVTTLIRNAHYAMLEHAVFTFEFKTADLISWISIDLDNSIAPNKFIHLSVTADEYSYVSANLRYMFEGEGCLWDEIITCLCYYDKELTDVVFHNEFPYSDYIGHEPHGKLITDITIIPESIRDTHDFRSVKFVTDRGVSHELVRHRVASFAQSSTRYCNYSKDKFGGEITFIDSSNWENMSKSEVLAMYNSFKAAEDAYMYLIKEGCTPQLARSVLPNQLMTEIVVTANMDEWHHIADLRLSGTTGAPHPDMKHIMTELSKIMPDM